MARAGRVLLPPRCLVCADPGADGHDLCAACMTQLPWNHASCRRCGVPMPVLSEAEGPVLSEAEGPVPSPAGAPETTVCGRCLRKPPPLERVLAAFDYRFPVDRLVPRFKFHHDLAAGRELAAALCTFVAPALAVDGERPQALIPVPLHTARLRERGYNQALELARPLARAFSIPLLRDALRRIRATAAQSDLGALARRRNPRGAFAVAGKPLPAHVALIDDVMTTGATVHECARVLHRAGVARVDAWVVARVPMR
ncbi:MAG: ComF family protein [Proteobacteria bacterium]|nr:ComF family protein [Pseudomonadota bacterium]